MAATLKRGVQEDLQGGPCSFSADETLAECHDVGIVVLARQAGRRFIMDERGAFIHVLGDTVQSVGVAIAGALIWWRPSLRLADPIMTLVFAVLVVLTTRSLVRDLFNILSERAPRGLETPAIEKALNAVPGVACVHDVHCWQLSPSTPALVTAHVTRRAGSDASVVLAAATAALAAMGLEHATLQIATAEEDAACAVARRKAAELAAAGAAGAV